jgi:hypothetical protein
MGQEDPLPETHTVLLHTPFCAARVLTDMPRSRPRNIQKRVGNAIRDGSRQNRDTTC